MEFQEIWVIFGILSSLVSIINTKSADHYAGCDFDTSFCNWTHNISNPFQWTRKRYHTPSYNTGPSADASGSGSGSYIYIEASTPRKYGDTARLISPVIEGPHCMSFLYHMYGTTMGSVVVYVKNNRTSDVIPVWIKSRNQYNQWRQANIYIDEQNQYQVFIDGIRGLDFASDAAIDDIKFVKGKCQNLTYQLIHVYFKEELNIFKLDTIPPYNAWVYDFSFNALQTKLHEDDTLYFIYPDKKCTKRILSKTFQLSNRDCIPFEFLYASKTRDNEKHKIVLLDRSNESQGIAPDSRGRCCGEMAIDYFYANVTTEDLSPCPPGWFSIDNSCYQYFTGSVSWNGARIRCVSRGGHVATPWTVSRMNALGNYLNKLQFRKPKAAFVGAGAQDHSHWEWFSRARVNRHFWGPGQPSGDGKCGSLIKGEEWDVAWRGYGWKLNDEPCNDPISFICQKKMTPNRTCESGWFALNSDCYHIYFGISTWENAKRICQDKGGLLASLDNENAINSMGAKLDTYPHFRGYNAKVFVGLKIVGLYQWVNGQPIYNRLWHGGAVDKYSSNMCGALTPYAGMWRMTQYDCSYHLVDYICQTEKRSKVIPRTAETNSSVSIGEAAFAVDGSYTTCFQTKKEDNPSIRIELQKEMFVTAVQIIVRRKCCLDKSADVRVLLGKEGSIPARCTVFQYVFPSSIKYFVCDATHKSSYLVLQASGSNTVLSLCEVMVYGSDAVQEFQGVFQELWYGVSSNYLSNLRVNPRFPLRPDAISTIKNFDAPYDININYGQWLTTYLHVPSNGNYTFYVACNNECELSIRTIKAFAWSMNGSMTSEEDSSGTTLLTLLSQYNAEHNGWTRYQSLRKSGPTPLSTCRLYKVVLLMKQGIGKDCASVGMRLPNGTYERPIPAKRLYWVHPGKREIHFELNDGIITVVTGTKGVIIKASYKYCCRGVYCPNCPIKLRFHFLDTAITIADSLAMDCREHNFTTKLDILAQPRHYLMKISYSFCRGLNEETEEKTVGTLTVLPKVYLRCRFEKNTCAWKNVNGWNLTTQNYDTPTPFLSLNHQRKASLESKWIISSHVLKTLGFCLRFNFLLPTLTSSSLQVVLRHRGIQNDTVLWSLSGYQGGEWSSGQMSWKALDHDFKIIFIGSSNSNDSISIGLDFVLLESAACPRLPTHSSPDYRCHKETQFQCSNGICINKDLVCDGDHFCIDGSDEKNCKCLSNQFSCSSGECLTPSQLCNGIKDCKDGSDESQCKKICPHDQFQCLSGSCVPWSQTCDNNYQCEDQTDEPEICGEGFCPLNNQSCMGNENRTETQECASSKVECDFERGLCGLTHDREGSFQWLLNSGPTPTKETGPGYDHTNMNYKGKYIYIEASDGHAGEKAQLSSDFIKGAQSICIQFWYHMNGIETGTLNVYSKTNSSVDLLWSRSGNKGNRWLFGEIGYHSESHVHRIILEGVIGSGPRGDIALDDLSISLDSCTTLDMGDIDTLSCNFDKDICNWKASHFWHVRPSSNHLHNLDNIYQSDGYLFLLPSKSRPIWEKLTSPVIKTSYGVKCFKFWYNLVIGGKLSTGIKVSVKVIKTRKMELWSWTEDTRGWQYAQIPLNYSQDYQIIIEGRKVTKYPKVGIDDIVFSKETCAIIPRYVDPPEIYKESFGAIKHWKLDGDDKDVKPVGAVTYLRDRGRFVTCLDGKTAYLETPAVDLRMTSFSITCWVMFMDAGVMSHIYSDWTDPFQFRFFVNQGLLTAELRGKGYVNIILQLSTKLSKTKGWKHVGFVWNRQSRSAYLYENALLKTIKGLSPNIDVDLQLTGHTSYEIGAKKDTKQFLRGCLRDLMVFDRALDYHTMRLLYSPSREMCPIRSTTAGDCCGFPYTFQNQSHDTCIYHESSFMCGTTRSKFGKCKVDEECGNLKDNWCGWEKVGKSGNQWKRGTLRDMTKFKSIASSKSGDYEASFPEDHTGYVNYTGLPDMTSFTICMWVKTSDRKHAGTLFVYRVYSEDVGAYVTAIGIFDYRNIYVNVDRLFSNVLGASLNDSVWHHVCIRWRNKDGFIAISIDARQYTGTFTQTRGDVIPGNGEFIIGATSSYAGAGGGELGQFVGTVSDVNIWTYFMSYKDLKLMSFGCEGQLTKPFMNWELFKDFFVGNISVRQPATCKDKQGVRALMTSHNMSDPGMTSSVYLSPVFRSSHLSYGQCLRFRYLIYGSGTRKLLIYQHLKVDNYVKRLVWFVNTSNSTESAWRYGKAAISGVSEYKISLEGSQGNEPGYIAVKGINVADGYCDALPSTAKKVCLKSLSKPSGILQSPFYPGYYSLNEHCTWYIKVQQDHFIRLYFLSFDLEDHPVCQKDFVSVYDGGKSKRIGKYCGARYPQFVESTGNFMIVVFKSDDNVIRSGFKAQYKAISKQRVITNETCTSYEGCPLNCECSLMSSDPESIMVNTRQGVTLTTIPADIAENTRALMLCNNRIDRLSAETFNENSNNIEYLDLSHNILMDIHGSSLQNLTRLETLRLNSNYLISLNGKTFNGLAQLTTLDLSNNLLTQIPSTLLSSLASLSSLSLRSNRLKSMEPTAFRNNRNLTSLYINLNDLTEIPDELFRNLKHLRILNLSNNKIKVFSAIMFEGLTSLEKLYLENNFPLKFSPSIFKSLPALKELHVDGFFLCCYAKKAIPDVKCISPKDFFSSCSDLMKNKTLQIFIWILGLSALLGNIFVVILRSVFKEDNKVHSFLLTNLAVADFLMGVYMLILAINDVTFQGEYFKHDFTWRTGKTCKLAGALSLLSSEVSVLLLTLITADRFKSIVFPFRFGKLRMKGACCIVALIWTIGLVLSVVPLLSLSYFYDESRRVGYYGRSALCLPLQLTRDKLAGWEYSVTIFIVLNLVSFTFILVAYILMFITVKRISSSIRSTVMSRESQMAKRMAFIIATDFCCWMPVIIIGILSLLDLFHDPEHQVYAWLAVFVLPVNSSINPILYTFSTPLLQNRLKFNKKLKDKWMSRTFLTTPSTIPATRLHNSRNSTGLSRINSTVGFGYTNLGAMNSSALDIPKEVNANNLSKHSAQELSTKTTNAPYMPTMNLRLVEIPDICKDDKQNSSMGFVVAWSEAVPGEISLRLVKHMAKKDEQAWKKEASIVSLLTSSGEHPNILSYCWHSRAVQTLQLYIRNEKKNSIAASEVNIKYNNDSLPEIKPNALLICYDFVSSTSLGDYLKDSQTTMNFDSLCAIALDLCNALEELHKNGVVHNNIKPSNILIGRCLRFPPILAVLGGFSRAEKVKPGKSLGKYKTLDTDLLLSKNIHQFGKILSTLICHCKTLNKCVEIQSVMELCVDQVFVKMITPSHIKEILSEIWCGTEVWDTYL